MVEGGLWTTCVIKNRVKNNRGKNKDKDENDAKMITY
jgi:hypothetical protein